MPRIACLAVMSGLLVSCFSTPTMADVLGDTLSASNTFESATVTGGVETIFQANSAIVEDSGVELNQFATIHDIDFTGDSMKLTLVSNDGLSTTLFTDGVFDRYYFGFNDNLIDSASLVSGDDELTAGLEISLLGPGYELAVADLFGTGVPVPQRFPNGGFMVELGAGTDYGTLGKSLTIGFTSSPVPEPTTGLMAVCGLSSLALLRRIPRECAA